jgi:hypothetical protein
VLSAVLEGGSPPPATLAALVKFAAFEATFTVRVMSGATLLAANTPVRVQVTVCPTKPQLQPVPLALTGVSPTGSVSVTEMVLPSVLPAPLLLAVSV